MSNNKNRVNFDIDSNRFINTIEIIWGESLVQIWEWDCYRGGSFSTLSPNPKFNFNPVSWSNRYSIKNPSPKSSISSGIPTIPTPKTQHTSTPCSSVFSTKAMIIPKSCSIMVRSFMFSSRKSWRGSRSWVPRVLLLVWCRIKRNPLLVKVPSQSSPIRQGAPYNHARKIRSQNKRIDRYQLPKSQHRLGVTTVPLVNKEPNRRAILFKKEHHHPSQDPPILLPSVSVKE